MTRPAFRDLRPFQGSSRRPAAGRDRDGGHADGDPDPRLVLARATPGDQPLIRQVKDDLREWKLVRVVWVADRGFQSAENRRYLQRAGGHYIIGEKLRGESKEAHAALARQGRYRTVAGNLEVKEVRVDDGTMRDRFVICRNPDQAERDKAVRDQLIAQLEDAIADSDQLSRGRARQARRPPAGQARTEAVPAPDPWRPAPDRPRRRARRGAPRRQVPAAQHRPDPDRRGHRARLQATAPSRARLARHEDHARPAARSTTARKTASAPTSSSAGWRCC